MDGLADPEHVVLLCLVGTEAISICRSSIRRHRLSGACEGARLGDCWSTSIVSFVEGLDAVRVG